MREFAPRTVLLPIMKSALIFLAMLVCLCLPASAKAYFQTKQEMIERAEVIAIITITDARPGDAKGRIWTYRQEGRAKVENILKGDIPRAFTLHGAETFICAQCPIANGRFFAFLKKDGDLWTGSNWHLSLRPIRNDEVDWYVADENRYEMKPVLLEKVVAEIKAQLAVKRPVP